VSQVPRINCSENGNRRVEVPWFRDGSRFILLFEQFFMSLVREMPVNAIARHVDVTNTCLWRIVRHYVSKAFSALNLKDPKAVDLDETAFKREHNYIVVFIDLGRSGKPVALAISGMGRCQTRSCAFIEVHKRRLENSVEVVCDMSPAFFSAVERKFKPASVASTGSMSSSSTPKTLLTSENSRGKTVKTAGQYPLGRAQRRGNFIHTESGERCILHQLILPG